MNLKNAIPSLSNFVTRTYCNANFPEKAKGKEAHDRTMIPIDMLPMSCPPGDSQEDTFMSNEIEMYWNDPTYFYWALLCAWKIEDGIFRAVCFSNYWIAILFTKHRSGNRRTCEGAAVGSLDNVSGHGDKR